MDLRSGKKLHHFFTQSGLDEIKTDHIFVDTNNSDRDAFANVIQSWQTFSVHTIGSQLNLTSKEQINLNKGYDAQIRAISNPAGFYNLGVGCLFRTKTNKERKLNNCRQLNDRSSRLTMQFRHLFIRQP